jgi:hypothetical protein
MKILIVFITMFIAFSCHSENQEEIARQEQQRAVGTISGTIVLSPELTASIQGDEVLYVIAKKEVGPPIAVKRVQQPQFPYTYFLSEADVMMPGTFFQGEVKVSVRLDKDGTVGPLQSGDMRGQYAYAVPIGAQNVNIVIDQRVP